MSIASTGAVSVQSAVPSRGRSLAQVFILLGSMFVFFALAGVFPAEYQQYIFLLGLPLAALMSWLFMRKDGGIGIGLRRPENWPKTIAWGLACGVGLLLVLIFVLNPLIHSWLGPWWDPTQFDALKGNVGQWAVNVFFVAWIHAAFCEEVIFRGFFLQRIERAFGGRGAALAIAVVISGALFGFAHLGNGLAAFVETGLAGMLIAGVFLAFKCNLWITIIAHALIDTVIFTLVYFGQHRLLLPG